MRLQPWRSRMSARRRRRRERLRRSAGRLSNGLKEFLWQLEGIGHGHLLDLGPARQTTITFFIERGYKVYTEDLLTTWKNFLDAEEQQGRSFRPVRTSPR